ncbi:hypothetical protein LZ31DRAFT_223179 [Colletotrichum somersetense]|nr:hypothetical protein LZ31DRAFT_223179 [Colletotrichum somersetense]
MIRPALVSEERSPTARPLLAHCWLFKALPWPTIPGACAPQQRQLDEDHDGMARSPPTSNRQYSRSLRRELVTQSWSTRGFLLLLLLLLPRAPGLEFTVWGGHGRGAFCRCGRLIRECFRARLGINLSPTATAGPNEAAGDLYLGGGRGFLSFLMFLFLLFWFCLRGVGVGMVVGCSMQWHFVRTS